MEPDEFWEEALRDPSWFDPKQKRAHWQVGKSCRAGIPTRLRPAVWYKLIGNELRITADLYAVLQRTVDDLRQGKGEENVAASPKLKRQASFLAHIQQDIQRTYPELAFFHEEGPLRESLVRILECFACFRAQVGYVQGLNYIGALLLLNMEELQAFQCLCNVAHSHPLLKLIHWDAEALRKNMELFDDLVCIKLPKLYRHLKRIEVPVETYALEWVLAMFASTLSLEVVSRIWDVYFGLLKPVDRQIFLWKAALALLALLADKLAKLDMAGALALLGKVDEEVNDADRLLTAISAITVSVSTYQTLLRKHELT